MTRAWLPVGLLTLLGALLRFPTLDAKSFWEDEVFTVLVVRHDFGGMLAAIPASEATPPLYYVLAWGWTHLFGDGEVGLRSLSALIGTAAIPVAFLAGRALVASRVGIVAAALIAVNPLLVWYSQEARSYALLVLTGGVSILLLIRALQVPSRAHLLWWAVACCIAVATHYFALFLVIPEAAWLLVRVTPRRRVALALVPVVAVCAALLPLALHQRKHPLWIQEIGLASRAVEIPGIFLIGFESPAPFVLVAIAGLLVLVAGWLLVYRSSRVEQHAALLVAGIGLVAVLLPLILSVAGVDFLLYKNVIAAVFPLALAAAVGFAASRASRVGPAAAAALCVLSIGIVLATAWEPKYHREDWRSVAAVLSEPAGARAIVVTPYAGKEPLELYLGATAVTEGQAALKEIVLVAAAQRPRGSRTTPETPRPPDPPAPAAGFELVQRVEGGKFTLFVYEAAEPVTVAVEQLGASAINPGETGPAVLVQGLSASP